MSKKPQGTPVPETAAPAPTQAETSPVAQTTTSSNTAVNFIHNINTPNLPGYGEAIVTGGIGTPNGSFPYGSTIGDPNGNYIGDPLPNTWPWPLTTTPSVPGIGGNGVAGTYLWTTPPQYWGVQEKTDAAKGGPQYWVVNPLTLLSLPLTAKIAARCDTENDARVVCMLLNEWYERRPCPNGCDGITSHCSDCPPESGPAIKDRPSDFTHSHVKDILQTLQGRVLTIIDAAISSDNQNKALKTLFKREFRKSISGVFDFAFRGMDVDRDHSDGEDGE